MFALGDARAKIENGEAIKSREMYFAIPSGTRQRRASVWPLQRIPTGFDLIIIDECHRGSAPETRATGAKFSTTSSPSSLA